MIQKMLMFLVLFWSTQIFASTQAVRVIRPGSFAPGVSLGFRSAGALSLKYWFQENLAVDLNLEYLGRSFSVLYADVHYQFPKLLTKSPGRLRESIPYVGAGLGAGTWHRNENCVRFDCTWKDGTRGSGDGYFLRLVTGLEWYPPKTRFGVFAELAPSYLLYPNPKLIFDFVLGFRFYL